MSDFYSGNQKVLHLDLHLTRTIEAALEIE